MTTKLRKESPRPGSRGNSGPSIPGPLRVVASGVVFLTHTITMSGELPPAGSNSRAQDVIRHRGGAAAACLSVISQFAGTQSWLIAPIGTGPEGEALRVELQREGISTQLCARREADGVPKAFVILSSCVSLSFLWPPFLFLHSRPLLACHLHCETPMFLV